MKDKIWAAIRKIKSEKGTGQDNVSVELLEACDAYAVDKISMTTLCIKIMYTKS